MHKKTSAHIKWFIAIQLATLSTPALSQNKVQNDRQNKFLVEEIVVTARKREESVNDVPLSISVYSAQELKYRQIDSTDQLTSVTPNLQFSSHAPSSGHNSAAVVFIRGVGQPDFLPSSDPGVGLYIDGVYVARSVGAVTRLLDLERIEILRGPQGTLFGRNTIGGAVSLHTARPSNTLSGGATLLIGDDQRLEFGGNISVPLSDDLSVKFSILSTERDGYVANKFTGKDLGDDSSLGLRIAADWQVADTINAYWTFDSVNEDENGAPTVFSTLNTSGLFARLAAGAAGPGPSVTNFGDRGVPGPNGIRQLCTFENSSGKNIDNTGFQTDIVLNCGTAGSFDLGNSAPFKNFANADIDSALDVVGTSLTLDFDLNYLNLKSITGYRKTEYDVIRDADSSPLTILHSENHDKIEQFSQEFQLTGAAFSERLQWTAGIYYFKEDADFVNPVFLPALTVGALNNGGALETQSLAFFGQASYDVTSRLHATVGARYTDEKKRVNPDFFAIGNYNVPNPFSTVGFRCGGPGLVTTNDPFDAINRPDAHCITLADGELLYANVENNLEFSQTTPTFSLSYDLSDRSIIYATYSQGFKSGGYSTRIIQPVPSAKNPDGVSLLPTFAPEEVETFEIGYKKQTGDLRFSAALFTTDYTNQHVVVRQGVAPITFNAGESSISGFEVEATWTPTENLLVTGGFGYTDGKYDSFSGVLADKLAAAQAAFEAGTGPSPDQVGGLVDLDDELAYTPKQSASIGASYLISSDNGTFTPRLDWSYRGKIFFDAPNTEVIAQNSTSLLNATISWSSPNSAWEAILAVRNLTGKLYRTAGNVSFSGSAYGESIFSRRREWSLSLRREF